MILLLISIALGLYLLYKLALIYVTGNNDYWSKKGVPYALTSEIASYYQMLTGKVVINDLDLYTYNKFKTQDPAFIGTMEMRSPVVQLRDLDLIKQVCIKDFDYFVNRRTFTLGDDLLDNHFLFFMQSQPWKELRSVITPSFTTGKIRRMFQHFNKSGQNLAEYITIQNRKGGQESGLNLRETFCRYSLDVISSTAFGMESNCLLNDQSVFMKMGKKLQTFDVARNVKLFVLLFAPRVGKWLKLAFLNSESTGFFKSVLKRNMDERVKLGNSGDQYHDFLELMIESRNPNQDQDHNKDNTEEIDDTFERDAQLKTSSKSSIKISDNAIIANSLTFFLAGSDALESLMTSITYHLAIYPEMQERLRNEILQATEGAGGEITYEALNKMVYLEMFFSEVLRLYPPATRAERKVVKPYKIPGTDITLPVDMVVTIPIQGIHWDEKHYPEPEKFDPERFSPENKAQRHPYAFMPFGHGPRNCIAIFCDESRVDESHGHGFTAIIFISGMRFAMFSTKAAIANLIKNFEVSPCAETQIPLKLENVSGSLKPHKDLKVAFKRL